MDVVVSVGAHALRCYNVTTFMDCRCPEMRQQLRAENADSNMQYGCYQAVELDPQAVL